MKDLIGYLKKILYLFNLLILFFPLSNISAAENFQIYTSFQHTLESDSINTEVVLQIRSDSPKVISYYTASIPIKNLQAKCKNLKTNQNLDCTLYHRGSITDILMDLKNAVVRPDSPIEILLTYTTPISEGYTYTMPSKIADTTTNTIVIKYPKEKGEPLWSSDPIENIKSVGENLEVVINKPAYSSISLLFGKNVTYRFEISKVFTNSLDGENQTFEIYVPSDTQNQLIIWDEITPLPNSTLLDEDGNYIFKYVVAPDESLDCTISGYIQMINPVSETLNRSYLTKTSGYWSIKNKTEFKRINNYVQRKGIEITEDFDSINKLEDVEKELFYKYIYQYVIERLNFNKDITLGTINETRLGANALVETPNESTATDYADLYIAILRSYQIPARMVVGYISNITGYTADGFYHHWVEYYDDVNKKWVISDPFLEEYFEKNLFGTPFFDHISILKRGKSPVAPKISFFNDSDFTVHSETQENIVPNFDINSELSFEEYRITNRYLKGYIYTTNTGNTVINGYTISKSNIANIQKYLDPVNNLSSKIILPKQSNKMQFNIPIEKLQEGNIFVKIKYSNQNLQNRDILIEKEINSIVPGYLIYIAKILSFFVFVVIAFLIYFLSKTIKKNE